MATFDHQRLANPIHRHTCPGAEGKQGLGAFGDSSNCSGGDLGFRWPGSDLMS
jgi:hypothetical protein